MIARSTVAPSTRHARARTAIAALGVMSIAFVACGTGPSGPTPRVLPDLSAGPTASTGAPPSGASATGSPGAGASPDAGLTVAVDPGLLSFIPIGGHGLVQSVDPDTTAQVAQNPALRVNASGLIMAVYTSVPTSASAAPSDDIAVVSVVRLRNPALDDAWFRGWRDSYDGSACANAGGVTRHAETVIATHTVFIGSCAGGSFTYHTRLAAGGIVISITSVGTAHLGQTIMERLAP